MAITAKFQADFTSFTAAVNKAEIELKSFEQGAARVEKSLKAMVDNFSGRKLIQDATLMAQAVERIGGPSRLTGQELQGVSAKADQAVQKLKALGLDVPPELQKLADKTKLAGTDTSKLDQLTGGLASRMAALAGPAAIGAVVAGIVKFAKDSFLLADQLQKMSDRTGIGVEDLQRLSVAAKDSGNTVDQLADALGMLEKNIGNESTGTLKAFADLKLDFDDIRTKAPLDRLQAIAQALFDMEDPSKRAAAGAALFGRSFDEIKPALKAVAEGLTETNLLMSKDTVHSLDAAGDAVVRFKDVAVVAVGTVVATMFKAVRGDAWRQFFFVDKPPDVNFGPAAQRMEKGLQRMTPTPLQLRSIEAMEADLKDLVKTGDKTANTADKMEREFREFRNEIGVRQRDAWLASQRAMTEFDRVATSRVIPSLQNLQKEIPVEEMLQFDQVTSLKVIPSLENMDEKFRELAPNIKTFKDVLKGSLGDLNSIFQRAFEGGGGIGGAIQSFATNFTAGILDMIPVIGGTLSQFAGAIVAGFKKLFGGLFGGEEKKINPLRQDFINLAGGLDELRKKIVEATGTDALLRKLLDADRVKEYEAAIKDVTAALDFQESAMEALRDATERYGFTIEELGPAFARQELDTKAQQLFKDWEILNSAGIDTVAITTRMADAVNDYVQTALKMGIEIPAAMRPMLEAMAKAGKLTDENGNAITDLEEAGISFALTMSEGFKQLIDEVKTLADVIARSLGLAIDRLPDRISIPIDVSVEQPEFPGVVPMAKGGMGMVTKPTLFLAGETGPEEFAFSGIGKRFSSRGGETEIHTHISLDGREIATSVERIKSDDVRRRKRFRAA